jgi:predicted metalloprotease
MPSSIARHTCAALSLLALLFFVLGAAPRAEAAAPAATMTPEAIAPFLDNTLAGVDTYWRETDAAAGRPAPSVRHVWAVPGAKIDTGCGVQATDTAAFYCPADDTIYISEVFASSLYNGVLASLPGQRAGFGRAVGEFAVAFVVAHEYGHNVQNERGVLAGHKRALPTELNADCVAGTWARWAFAHGRLDPADAKDALNAALAVGDFDILSPQHHGTPQERRDALQTGLSNDSPSSCDKYLLLP